MKNYKMIVVLVALPFLALGCSPDALPQVSDIGQNIQQEVQNQVANEVNQQIQNVTDQLLPDAKSLSYQGQEGKTALEILKSKYKVETQEYQGLGEFVKSISGVTPKADEYWSFYVNGKPSTVGAGQYQSKATDKIEWKIESTGSFNQ